MSIFLHMETSSMNNVTNNTVGAGTSAETIIAGFLSPNLPELTGGTYVGPRPHVQRVAGWTA